MKHKMEKNGRKKVVVACGTFDLVHMGHVHYLQHARKHGDYLRVIVARDENVKKVKGFFPVQDEKTRVKMIQALKWVDEAVLGSKTNMYDKVKQLHPDVLALGYDQRPSNDVIQKELAKRNCFPQIVRITAFKAKKYKSSILRASAGNHYQKTST